MLKSAAMLPPSTISRYSCSSIEFAGLLMGRAFNYKGSLDHNGQDVLLVRIYLPIQKLEKIRPSKSSLENAPVTSPSASCDNRRSSANNSPARSFLSASLPR